MTLDQKLETAVLVTLWIEFFYDLLWNNREAQIKRRKANVKKAKDPRNQIAISNTPNLEPERGTTSNSQSGDKR
jgi:hypothetical protein